MTDPITRAEIERDISLLADPEVDIAMSRVGPTHWQLMVRRRRGISRDPQFRFRDPDRA